MEELFGLADDIRAILVRLNAYQGPGITDVTSKAYNNVDSGLSDILGVLTEGKADHTIYPFLLDNPDETTKECVRMWKEWEEIG
jgi:hypothetical protein